MTDKQKQAVELLNYIRGKKDSEGECVMSAEEYLTLLDFIVGEQHQVTYIPYTPDLTPQQPLTPYYQQTIPCNPVMPYRVTCCGTSTTFMTNTKEE